jgi:O-antigen ligase
LVLLAVFVSLLGGRFTLQQVSPGLPAMDLRWVAFGASLVAFLGWIAVARERAAPRVDVHGLTVPFLAWCSWMAFSALWTHPPARVAAVLLDFTFLAAFTLLGIAVASRLSAKAVSAVWTWTLVAGLVYFAGAMAGSPDAQGRYAAFGGGPNVFVRVMMLAALAATFLAARRHRVVYLLALPPLLLGAVLSGSRGGLVAGLLVTLLGGVFVLRRLPRRAIPFSVIALGATVFLTPRLLGAAAQAGLQQRFVQQTVEQRYDSSRGTILEGAWGLFERNVFTGAGLDGYYAEIGHGLTIEYPHNFFVASAAEGGLVGLGLLLVAIWHLVSAARHTRPMSTVGLFFLLAGGFVVFASMFSGDYYDSRMAWFFLGLAAVEGRRPRDASVAPVDSARSSRGRQLQPPG